MAVNRCVILLLFAFCVCPLQAAIAVTDDRGVVVSLEQPAKRIISLAPHTTELLYDAGAGDRVVGVAAYSDYPEDAGRKPIIGDYARLDFERILALKPDLAIAWASGNPGGDTSRLEKLGIKVYVTEPDSMTSIATHIRKLGQLAGTAAQADAAADRFLHELTLLRRRYEGRPPLTVFYQLWGTPLMTVSGRHLISEVLSLCGGRNIFSDLAMLSATVSVEAVVAADPQVIIAGAEQSREEEFAALKPWTQLAANRYGNLFSIPPDYLHRATPRILRGMRLACEQLDTARERIARAEKE